VHSSFSSPSLLLTASVLSLCRSMKSGASCRAWRRRYVATLHTTLHTTLYRADTGTRTQTQAHFGGHRDTKGHVRKHNRTSACRMPRRRWDRHARARAGRQATRTHHTPPPPTSFRILHAAPAQLQVCLEELVLLRSSFQQRAHPVYLRTEAPQSHIPLRYATGADLLLPVELGGVVARAAGLGDRATPLSLCPLPCKSDFNVLTVPGSAGENSRC
jgi:hypothetical protein